jgi:hypothetical protein
MRKAIAILSVVFGVLLLGAAQTAANPIAWPPGTISLTRDAAGTDPIINDPQGTVRVYVFLSVYARTDAVACNFWAPKPSCFNAEYVGETHYFPLTIGDSQSGMVIAFGSCVSPQRLLARITYNVLGPTPQCCIYWVRPHPESESGHIEIVNCQDQVIYGEPGYMIFNSDATRCESVVPAESSTWGKVKALYAQ